MIPMFIDIFHLQIPQIFQIIINTYKYWPYPHFSFFCFISGIIIYLIFQVSTTLPAPINPSPAVSVPKSMKHFSSLFTLPPQKWKLSIFPHLECEWYTKWAHTGDNADLVYKAFQDWPWPASPAASRSPSPALHTSDTAFGSVLGVFPHTLTPLYMFPG